MTVIPAQVAGVERIVVTSPHPARETLAAAAMLGVTEFYRVGGAQAIAALAYGTESMPRVDKIVGPGNAWVTGAKKLVAFDCAIDMLAGPTEAVVTSEIGDPASVAADLVAQAEHDPYALAIFITTQPSLAKAVITEVKRRARGNTIATAALTNHGLAIVARSVQEARDLTNRVAPEHLTVDSAADLAWVRNAGSVFIGRWSAQPLGDYIFDRLLPGAGARRPQRARLPQIHHGPGIFSAGRPAARPCSHPPCECRGPRGSRGRDPRARCPWLTSNFVARSPPPLFAA